MVVTVVGCFRRNVIKIKINKKTSLDKSVWFMHPCFSYYIDLGFLLSYLTDHKFKILTNSKLVKDEGTRLSYQLILFYFTTIMSLNYQLKVI